MFYGKKALGTSSEEFRFRVGFPSFDYSLITNEFVAQIFTSNMNLWLIMLRNFSRLTEQHFADVKIGVNEKYL
jgi:hypothetical protein